MEDVALEDAQIIWDAEDASLPAVRVVAIPGADDNRYDASWGKCNQDYAEADTAGRLDMLFRQFAYMTAIDGVPAKALHDALMVIPEYRREMADFGAVDPADADR